MSTPDSRRTTRPRAQYEAPQRRGVTGPIVAIGAIIFLIAAGVVVYQYYQKVTSITVSATTANFVRVDDRTLNVEVDVNRDDVDVASYCIVTAMNYDKAEIGRREFVIEPGGNKVQRFKVDIPTRDLPVAAKVYGCATEMPSYLKP
ncbi:DUF4307 domain-containing protein [Corynebacterium epidermidicanis]|uniref:Putative DUF4307 family protein n=1 Tax=Corynebacterium epidermidicanis TaxID=1050174 RepID=A0A0G3GNG4_9CORY|nr:DUF4307 domain-containing protein [Corynebacterium epidermidicanis]AKK02746.1 putative DUF4307 family protein [Corynebacterium epidermidicanis]